MEAARSPVQEDEVAGYPVPGLGAAGCPVVGMEAVGRPVPEDETAGCPVAGLEAAGSPVSEDDVTGCSVLGITADNKPAVGLRDLGSNSGCAMNRSIICSVSFGNSDRLLPLKFFQGWTY